MKKFTKVKVLISILLIAILTSVIAVCLIKASTKVDTATVSEGSLEAPTEVEQATITIKYVDNEQNELGTDSISGSVGSMYETTRKSFDGYVASGDEPFNKKGTYVSGGDTVTYVYEVGDNITTSVGTDNQINIGINNRKLRQEVDFKIVAKVKDTKNVVSNLENAQFEIKKGTTVVKSGSTLASGEMFVGTVTVRSEETVKYIIEEKNVEGEIVKKLKAPFELSVVKTWNAADGKYDVSLTYDNTIEGVSAEIVDGVIVVTVNHEKVSGNYTMEIITKDEDTGNTVEGATFKITKDQSSYSKDVTTDDNGKADVDSFEITEDTKEVEVYYIEQTSAADNYDIVISEPFRLQVTKIFENEAYKIELDYDTTKAYVEVELDNDNEIIIYVSAARESAYDLGIDFFAINLDDTELNRESVIKINNSKLSFEENKIELCVANTQKIDFEVRAYNNSGYDMLGKAIKIAIPSGMIFDKTSQINNNYDWVMFKENSNGILVETENSEEATHIISTYLEDKTLTKIDENMSTLIPYENLQVSFIIDESKVSGNRKLVPTAEVVVTNKDTDDSNNKSSEYLYVKYFDLDVTKYISKVKVVTDGVEEEKDYGNDKTDEVVKIDVARSKLDSTTVTIEYGIRVSNIGEIDGYAFEVTDYLPDGLTFDQSKNPDWYLDGNKLVSTALNAIKLKPGDTADLTVILDWKLSQNSVGEKVNKAKITEYYNEYDSPDDTDDNDDDEKIIVTVKTGANSYITIVLGTLVVLALAVTALKLKNLNGGEKHGK